MGIWDLISSGAETVKRNTPDLSTPVTKVCKPSYYYSAAAVRKIDDVVRVNGLQKLGQYIYMPDEEGRAKIVNFSTKFVKNASLYAAKEAGNSFIPGFTCRGFSDGKPMKKRTWKTDSNLNSGKLGGRAVSQIYSQTVREMEIEYKKNQITSCNKEITGCSSKDTSCSGPPEVLNGAEVLKLGSENKVEVDSFAHQTPEDVLRVFMMKEFMGTRFLDNLLVPDHRQQKKV